MEKIRELAQEDLKQPTANLADLMYNSVGMEDSRHNLQLSTSIWQPRYVYYLLNDVHPPVIHAPLINSSLTVG